MSQSTVTPHPEPLQSPGLPHDESRGFITPLRLISLIGALAVVLIAGWLWFSPWGTGEYAESPNGRYRASASNLRRGTWFRGRVDYVEVTIIELSTGKTVWEVKRFPLSGERPPDFSDRSKRHITWASDSGSVSVPVGGPVDAVWMVP